MLNTNADAQPAVVKDLIFAIIFTNCIHNCHSLCLGPFELSHSHYYPLSRAMVPCRYFAYDVIPGHSECFIIDLSGTAIVAKVPPQISHSDSDSQSSYSEETVLEALSKHQSPVDENLHIIQSDAGFRRRVFLNRSNHLSCFHCFEGLLEGIHAVVVVDIAHANSQLTPTNFDFNMDQFYSTTSGVEWDPCRKEAPL